MKTFFWNKYTNPALTLVFFGLVFTGIILEFVLPPGSGHGRYRDRGQGQGWRDGRGGHDWEAWWLGGDEALQQSVGPRTFWSLGRHDWGAVHFYLSIVFTAGIGLHLVLNWKWIRCAYFGGGTKKTADADFCRDERGRRDEQ